MIRFTGAFCGLLLWTSAAPAQMPFAPPAGCTGWLTVQARQCRVSNYYTCAADAPGDQWRVDFDQDGPFFLSRTDYEGQWMESIDLFPAQRQSLAPGSKDPASFSALLGGLDTFAFELTKEDGTQTRVKGYDRLSGRVVVIDGINLQQTEFEFAETDADGNLLRQSRGAEYINPDWRLFFAGPSEWDGGAGYVSIDGSPVEFIFPGEPGFFGTRPLFGCDAVMSGLRGGQQEGHGHDG